MIKLKPCIKIKYSDFLSCEHGCQLTDEARHITYCSCMKWRKEGERIIRGCEEVKPSENTGLMICPKHKECNSKDCFSRKPHPIHSSCSFESSQCPKCVPYVPEPKPNFKHISINGVVYLTTSDQLTGFEILKLMGPHASNRVYVVSKYNKDVPVPMDSPINIISGTEFTTIQRDHRLEVENKDLKQKIAQMESHTNDLEKVIAGLQKEHTNTVKELLKARGAIEEHYRTHAHNNQFVKTLEYCHKANMKKIGDIFKIDPTNISFNDFISKIKHEVERLQDHHESSTTVIKNQTNTINALSYKNSVLESRLSKSIENNGLDKQNRINALAEDVRKLKEENRILKIRESTLYDFIKAGLRR